MCFVFCAGDTLLMSSDMPELPMVGINISHKVLNNIRCWSIQSFQQRRNRQECECLYIHLMSCKGEDKVDASR